jgi:hypothetical protein
LLLTDLRATSKPHPAPPPPATRHPSLNGVRCPSPRGIPTHSLPHPSSPPTSYSCHHPMSCTRCPRTSSYSFPFTPSEPSPPAITPPPATSPGPSQPSLRRRRTARHCLQQGGGGGLASRGPLAQDGSEMAAWRLRERACRECVHRLRPCLRGRPREWRKLPWVE